MKKKVVGIGEYLVTNSPDEYLCTFALGSCVALTLHFPAAQVAGMTHVALPDSLISTSRDNQRRPAYYADKAVPALLAAMKKAIALQNFTSLHGVTAKLIGGATVIKIKNDFHIGARIARALENQLIYHHIPITAHAVGGNVSRTVKIYPDTGQVVISSPGRQPRIL